MEWEIANNAYHVRAYEVEALVIQFQRPLKEKD